jgi:RNA polymerase sigma factor (sigma-70 family)
MTQTNASRGTAAGEEPDAELLNQVALGNDRAMKMLYLRHHDLVHGFTRRQLCDVSVVEEVVQDVFVAVFRNPTAFQGTSAFSTYLCSIARLKVIDRFRERERERAVVLDEVAEETLTAVPDETEIADVLLQVGRRQALAHIEACMDLLPDVQRDALFWTYFQDERDHEVAVRQEVSQGTVKSRLNAARQSLKRCLSQRARGGLHV